MQLKTCTICRQELPMSEFYKHKYSSEGVRSECKSCTKKYNKKYYDENREEIIQHVAKYAHENKDKISEGHKKYRQKKAETLKETFKNRDKNKRSKMDALKTPCVKCGDERLYLIDFHHVDPSRKSFTIGNSFRRIDDVILAEVQKCVCLCSNCHREFHHIYGIIPSDPVNQLKEYLGYNLEALQRGECDERNSLEPENLS